MNGENVQMALARLTAGSGQGMNAETYGTAEDVFGRVGKIMPADADIMAGRIDTTRRALLEIDPAAGVKIGDRVTAGGVCWTVTAVESHPVRSVELAQAEVRA